MRKHIKQEIIQTAKRLFNERGYNQVSTQDIAEALGISKGNLNYHFKRKEDMLDAIVEEMHSHYVVPDPPATLRQLNDLFLDLLRVTKENAFYFWHYTQLSQVSEKVPLHTNLGDSAELHPVFQSLSAVKRGGEPPGRGLSGNMNRSSAPSC